MTTTHMTVQEVANELKIGKMQVHALVDQGQLPAINVGAGGKKYWRIPRADFEAFLASRRSGVGPVSGDAA